MERSHQQSFFITDSLLDLEMNKSFSVGFDREMSFVKEEALSMDLDQNKSINSFVIKKDDLKPVPAKAKLQDNTQDQDYKHQLNKYLLEGHKKAKRRGSYKICTLDRKMEAIRIARIKTIKEASEMLEIPEKNIKRWIQNGPERKKGAGRKTMDPDMERSLLNWVAKQFRRTGVFPDSKEIKIQARIYSNQDNFKASKGWCDKFLRRNQRWFDLLKKEQSGQDPPHLELVAQTEDEGEEEGEIK